MFPRDKEHIEDVRCAVRNAYGHMVFAMMVAEQVGVRIMKEYFGIKASKATPQYRFGKGLKLFSDKGY